MVFSNTTTRAGIVEDTSWLIFGDSENHTAEYPLTDVARNVNRHYDIAVSDILRADSRFEWDDNNKTDLPIGRISLVANQQDYGIDGATFLSISKIDIIDANGNWLPLKQINLQQLRSVADAAFESTAGTPKYFRLQANSLFLYPKPNYSYTNGIRIFYQRNVDYFVSTDTTKVPGFAEPYHRLLSIGAALEYALTNNMQQKIRILTDMHEKMRAGMISFYERRNTSDKVSLAVQREDYGEAALGSMQTGGNPFNHTDRFYL